VPWQESSCQEWIYNQRDGAALTARNATDPGASPSAANPARAPQVVNHGRDRFVELLARRSKRISASTSAGVNVLARIDDDNAGRYRQVAVRIAGARHIPPEPWDVPALMDDLVTWMASRAARKLHPIERASIAHHRFVAIHPFVDGNGRTGRLLLNLLLFRDGYPPAVIERTNRRQYYTVLAAADHDDRRGLTNLIARACERSLRLYVEACKPVTVAPAKADRWISLAQAAKGTPYSQEYLTCWRTDKLRAKKMGGTG
jgi:hypothetical protein